MPRIPADIWLTCVQMSEFQSVVSTLWIHIIYICVIVEPPHWRAFSRIVRMGRPA